MAATNGAWGAYDDGHAAFGGGAATSAMPLAMATAAQLILACHQADGGRYALIAGLATSVSSSFAVATSPPLGGATNAIAATALYALVAGQHAVIGRCHQSGALFATTGAPAVVGAHHPRLVGRQRLIFYATTTA